MSDAPSQSLVQSRQLALKVGKWLASSGRADEAIGVLAAWAAVGPNDAEGQKLMAEALRVNPQAPLARQAFERMEGVEGDHSELQRAIEQYSAQALQDLQKQMPKAGAFRRAQLGFNNNVKYKGMVFHIQTEDSGLDKPNIITHLFADGGRIIKTHKRNYADHVTREDVGEYVRGLMKGQQMEMAIMLREGLFDEVIAGRALGGSTTLEEPPRIEPMKRKAPAANAEAQAPKAVFKVQGEAPAAASASPAASQASPEAQQPAASGVQSAVRYVPPYRLVVERSAGHDPALYEPTSDRCIIGRSGDVRLPNERFCHPHEAQMIWRDGSLFLRDLPGGNGVFLRVQHLVELHAGDEFVVGDQLLRVDTTPEQYDDGPTVEPTYFYSSPKWPSSFRVTQLFEGGVEGLSVMARSSCVSIGAKMGDMVFAHDPLVSAQHCFVEEQAGAIMLTDLESRTGVFVRVNGEQELMHGDELLIGRTRLRLEFLKRAEA